ncbi:hypothetical protein [Streptomyces alboflavus]|uniref:hypothetical protein n=1 Tax=Streptomyces alboflavus TaxID=67267 RepID=UPI0004BE9F2A|nr:hypothetical protein [Streptomyces alboflavus]
MTGDGFSFELRRVEPTVKLKFRDRVYWWTGDVGGLGAVELAHPAREVLARDDYQSLMGAAVRGDSIPPSSYKGLAYGSIGRPRLARGTLTVAGQRAGFSRNPWAYGKRGRALLIRALGREYRYVEGPDKLHHTLERDGVKVSMSRSGWAKPQSISGVTYGASDSIDLSLAILLEGVYTRNLSLGGALISGPGRFTDRVLG